MFFLISCENKSEKQDSTFNESASNGSEAPVDRTMEASPLPPAFRIDTRNVSPSELVNFALSLQGTPYKFACSNPNEGFDCSGFITYVFNHFKIAVPRSSAEFENHGKEISVTEAKPGDLILFTGTDSTKKDIGHMGIIISKGEPAQFIHSTSGKAYGVTITPLNEYYRGRLVKVIRVFGKHAVRDNRP